MVAVSSGPAMRTASDLRPGVWIAINEIIHPYLTDLPRHVFLGYPNGSVSVLVLARGF